MGAMSFQPLEPRVSRLEGAYEQVDRRLEGIDRRLETLDRKVDDFRTEVGRRFDALSWRMTSLILGTWVTVMLAIFFHRV